LRPRAFILVYNAAYGEQTISVEEREAIGRFEVDLKPGAYYVFVALDGYEPTCRVVRITAGKVAEYNPEVGPAVEIEDRYCTATRVILGTIPLSKPPVIEQPVIRIGPE